ncbi:TPA: AAA family ATPase [Streptococcus suis]|nr:AAA family ATPase [Streptococcus suis]HEM6279116.1 AAA family ATPase [Streptococcus suis]
MYLYSLKIKGFKRHKETEVLFSDASFLIGENNVGKSSVLEAISCLLSNTKIDTKLFYKDGQNIDGVEEVVLEAEFRNLSNEAESWRGFRGRLFPYYEEGETKYSYFYRKTYTKNGNIKIEAKSRKKEIKDKFESLKSVQEFIDSIPDFDISLLADSKFKQTDSLTAKQRREFIDYFESDFEFYNYEEDSEEWVENPGGIAGNVLSKLPKLLFIPANEGIDDLGENKGALQEVLSELFREVREGSENYIKAQQYLNELSKEMDADNPDTEFGKMMIELNQTMDNVFSGISMQAKAVLTDADSSIKPKFNITMQSNIETSVDQQGTGVIRSVVFALLRYKAARDLKKQESSANRDLIICFEEPEIYLHLNAANQLRDTIYDLARSTNNQIICTTHSPYMIDLSRKAGQILNYLSVNTIDNVDIISNVPFNHEHAFSTLQSDDRSYIKMLLKMDDYLARVFFAKNILIIEGDTEEIVLRETILAMPEDMRKNVRNNWQIIRARGKAVIISLIKYLKAMGIEPYVIHDRDQGTDRAEQFNEPIKVALGNDDKLFVLEECIEDTLGSDVPNSEKPYNAYKFIQDNWIDDEGNYDYNRVSNKWREIMKKLFGNE